jgi:hypothetical protein
MKAVRGLCVIKVFGQGEGACMRAGRIDAVGPSRVMRRIAAQLLVAAIASTGSATWSGSVADELPGARSQAGAGGTVTPRRQRVQVTRAQTPTLQLVPPCEEHLFAELLECVPRPYAILPPFDGAVLNALHGMPPRSGRPFPALFSW